MSSKQDTLPSPDQAPISLEEFARDYRERFEETADREVLERASYPNVFRWTIEFPRLKENKIGRLVPTVKARLANRELFYITLEERSNFRIGLCCEVSTYSRENWKSSGYPLEFQTLNRIDSFVEHRSRRDKCYRIRRKLSEFSDTKKPGQRWYFHVDLQKRKGNSPDLRLEYNSDIPWSMRQILYSRKISPHHLLTLPPARTIQAPRSKFPFPDMKERLNAKELDERGLPDQLGLCRFDFVRTRVFRSNDWVESWLGRFVDLHLLKFVHKMELPVLRAMIRATVDDSISRESLELLNNIIQNLGLLAPTNAVNHFIHRIFLYFGYRLQKKDKLSICEHCDQFMLKTAHNKLYCNKHTEGKSCDRKAHHLRDYKKHRPKRQETARKYKKYVRDFDISHRDLL